jgi:predicted RNase H-like nuclease (RuvC/YqgF family)
VKWWEATLLGGSGAGGGSLIWRVLRSRKVREIAADVLDGPDGGKSGLEDLRIILDEQRRGYEHLAERVGTLEETIVSLEERLLEEKNRAETLEKQLKSERKSASAKVRTLEKQLKEARQRIDHLEALIASYHITPDGTAPNVED